MKKKQSSLNVKKEQKYEDFAPQEIEWANDLIDFCFFAAEVLHQGLPYEKRDDEDFFVKRLNDKEVREYCSHHRLEYNENSRRIISEYAIINEIVMDLAQEYVRGINKKIGSFEYGVLHAFIKEMSLQLLEKCWKHQIAEESGLEVGEVTILRGDAV